LDAPFPEAMMPCIEKFFREVHPTLKRGRALYPEVFETELFFPLQRRAELMAMMGVARQTRKPCPKCNGKGFNCESNEGDLIVGGPLTCDICHDRGVRLVVPNSAGQYRVSTVESAPVTVMEIGADKGGSLYHWIMCLPTVKFVIACEVRGTPYRHLFEAAFPDAEFLWLEGSSYAPETVERVANWLAMRDLSITEKRRIDCLFIDGDKGAFDKDFAAYAGMVQHGGRVFLHDVQDDGGPRETFVKLQAQGYATDVILNKTDSYIAHEREVRGIACADAYEGWLRYWRGQSCGVGVIYL